MRLIFGDFPEEPKDLLFLFIVDVGAAVSRLVLATQDLPN